MLILSYSTVYGIAHLSPELYGLQLYMINPLLPRISTVWYDAQMANVPPQQQVENALIHDQQWQFIIYVIQN